MIFAPSFRKCTAPHFFRGIVIFLLLVHVGYAQQNAALYSSDRFAKLLHYYQMNGSLQTEFPLNQPFSVEELLKKQQNVVGSSWGKLLYDHIAVYANDTIDHKQYLTFEPSVTGFARNGVVSKFYRLSVSGAYNTEHVAFRTEALVDESFKNDKQFYGNASEDFYGIVNEAYVNAAFGNFSIFFGRIPRSFASGDAVSLILSRNPYPYDHLSFSYQGKKLKYTFLATRLNDMYGSDIRKAGDTAGWYKRYFTVHRLDYALSENLNFGLTECILYGGKNQNFLMYYVNPLSPFVLTQYNQEQSHDGNDANLLEALDVLWKPSKAFTWYTQFLIDDIDFKLSNINKYPSRLGVYSRCSFADVLVEKSLLELSYLQTSNWTYTSFYNWANYVSFGKSIGYPKNSTRSLAVAYTDLRFFPFLISTEAKYADDGDQNLTNHFVATKTKFPLGVVQNSLQLALSISYIPTIATQIDLVTQITSYSNYQHIKGQKRSEFAVFASGKLFFVLPYQNW